VGSVVLIKVNKDIIYYISNDLEEKTGFFLNCKTNIILKLDSIAVEYFLKIVNANNREEVEEYLPYFEGCDIFE